VDGYNEIHDIIDGFSAALTKELESKLTTIGKSFKEDLKKVLSKKECNEKIIAKICDLNNKKEALPQEIKRIEEILEDLD